MKQTEKREHLLIINGQEALPADYKRVVNAPSRPVVKDDRATKPIETVSRGFSLLRK